MMRLRFRLLIFLLCIFSVGSLYWYRAGLANITMRYLIRKEFPTLKNSEITIGDVAFQGLGIVFKQISLRESGELTFQAESFTAELIYERENRRFNSRLAVRGVEIDLTRKKSGTVNFSLNPLLKFCRSFQNSSIGIVSGSLRFDTEKDSLHFHAMPSDVRGHVLSLSFGMGDEKEGSVDLFVKNRSVYASCHLLDFDLQNYARESRGIFNGRFEVGVGEGQKIEHLAAELTAKKAVFNRPAISIESDDLRMNLSMKENRSLVLGASTWKNWLENCSLDLNCDALSVHYDQWKLEGGHLYWGERHLKKSKGHLSGALMCGDESKPLECFAFIDWDQADLGLDLNLDQDKKLVMRSDWNQCSLQAFEISPYLLNLIASSTTHNLLFRSGEVSFSGLYRPGSISLESLDVSHLDLQGDSFCLGAETIMAKGAWGEQKGADFILENLSFYHLDRQIGEKVCGEFGWQGSVIKPSHLKGMFFGINGESSFGGDLSSVAFETHVDVGDEMVSSNGILDFSEKKLFVKGQLGIADHEWVDVVGFTGSIDRSNGWLSSIDQSQIEIEFSAKNLSENVYGKILNRFQLPWTVWGLASVRGKVGKSCAHLDVQPVNLYFDSRDLIAKMGAPDDFPISHFELDFEKREWRGDLAIAGASFLLKKPAVCFDHVFADAKLEGLSLLTTNLKAVSEDVAFSAGLSLSIPAEDQLDVVIDVEDVTGDAANLITFLNHFEDMRNLHLPLSGPIHTVSGSHIEVSEVKGKVTSTQQFSVVLDEGTLCLSDKMQLKNLHLGLDWNSKSSQLDFNDVHGEFHAGGKPAMEFVAKNLRAESVLAGLWEYDFRIGNRTHDVLRVKGRSKIEDETIRFGIDREHSFFLTSKLEKLDLWLSQKYEPLGMRLAADLGADEFINAAQLASSGGLIEIPDAGVEKIKGRSFDGETHFSLKCDFGEKLSQIEIESDGWEVDKQKIGPIDICLFSQKGLLNLQKGDVGSFSGAFALREIEDGYEVESLQCKHKEHAIHLSGGTLRKDLWKLNVQKFDVGLALLGLTLGGRVEGAGDVEVRFGQDGSWKKVSGDLDLKAREVGNGLFEVKSSGPLNLSLTSDGILNIENLCLSAAHDDEETKFLRANRFVYSRAQNRWEGAGVQVSLQPEFVKELANSGDVPGLTLRGKKKLQIGSVALNWENLMEAEFDFLWTPEQVAAHGLLKEGYYWIGDRSWFMKDCAFNWQQNQLKMAATVDFDALMLDLNASVYFGRETLISLSASEVKEKGDKPMTLSARYSPDDGFQLLSLEGELYGLSCNFTRNPRAYLPNQLILSGQLLVDMQRLEPLLPSYWQEKVKSFDMGDGYELSGDVVFALDKPSHSHFKGFLKGRDFYVGGCVLKTLFSSVDINEKGVFFYDFRLSDPAGVIAAKQIDLNRLETGWSINASEVSMQDFRPSLLRMVRRERGPLRPFLIKELYLFNFQGEFGKLESFSGRGHLDFFNTFKRDYHLLDIPIDIIGRLGLDLGLFVPVKGKIQYVVNDGQIQLTQLTSCYSDGERSQFYLSPSKTSAIEFDGRLNIDIKMKQYVLLKITQPLTLTVRGTLFKPRYGVK